MRNSGTQEEPDRINRQVGKLMVCDRDEDTSATVHTKFKG